MRSYAPSESAHGDSTGAVGRAIFRTPGRAVRLNGSISPGTNGPLSMEPRVGMLPGGYDFIHLLFWPIVAVIAVGTNLIPIVLSAGIGILLLETIKGK